MQLNLRVLSCSNIPRPEDIISIDPYITFNLTFSKKSQKTYVIDNSFDPIWKQDFQIPINPSESNFGIDISLCSRDVFNEDFEIGSVTGIIEDLKPYEIREESFEINIVDIDKEKRDAELLSKPISPDHLYTPKFLPNTEQEENKSDTKEEDKTDSEQSNKKKGTYATFVFQIAPRYHPPFTKEGTPPRPFEQSKISSDSYRKNNSSYFLPSFGHYIPRGGYDKYPYPQRNDRSTNLFSYKASRDIGSRGQFKPRFNYEFSKNSYKPQFQFNSPTSTSRFRRNRDTTVALPNSTSTDDSMPKPYSFLMNSSINNNEDMNLTPRKVPSASTRRFNFDFSPNRNQYEDSFSTLDSTSRITSASTHPQNSSFESYMKTYQPKAYNPTRLSSVSSTSQIISSGSTNTPKSYVSFDKNGKPTSMNVSPQKYDFQLNEKGSSIYDKARNTIQLALKSRLANANQSAQNSSSATNEMHAIYLNKDPNNKTQVPLEKSDQNNKTQKSNNSDEVPNFMSYYKDFFDSNNTNKNNNNSNRVDNLSNLFGNYNLQPDEDYSDEDEDEDEDIHSYRSHFFGNEDSLSEDEDEDENDYSDMEEDNFNNLSQRQSGYYTPSGNNSRKRTSSYIPSSYYPSQNPSKYLYNLDQSDDDDVVEIIPPKFDKEPSKPPKSSIIQQNQPFQQTSQIKGRANSSPQSKSQSIPPLKETDTKDEKNEKSNRRDIRFFFGPEEKEKPTGDIKFVFNNSNNNDIKSQQNDNKNTEINQQHTANTSENAGPVIVHYQAQKKGNSKKKNSRDNSPNNNNN